MENIMEILELLRGMEHEDEKTVKDYLTKIADEYETIENIIFEIGWSTIWKNYKKPQKQINKKSISYLKVIK